MVQKKEYDLTDIHIRNTNLNLSKKYTTLKGYFPSTTKNALLINALDKGLSVLLNETSPSVDRLESLLDNQSKMIQKTIMQESRKIIDNTIMLSVILKINEMMMSTVLQSLDFFMKTNDVEVPEEALEQFRLSLPDIFSKQKAELLKKFFDSQGE